LITIYPLALQGPEEGSPLEEAGRAIQKEAFEELEVSKVDSKG
jgi:hypothetical protein